MNPFKYTTYLWYLWNRVNRVGFFVLAQLISEEEEGTGLFVQLMELNSLAHVAFLCTLMRRDSIDKRVASASPMADGQMEKLRLRLLAGFMEQFWPKQSHFPPPSAGAAGVSDERNKNGKCSFQPSYFPGDALTALRLHPGGFSEPP